jgi:predicted RNA-binding protein with PUA-like domain
MPARWLVKEEPRTYGYDSLARDGTTTWSGVRNPLAQRHLKAIRKGDRILYYHTGGEKAVVGIARAVTNAYPDPKDRSGKLAAVDIAPVRRLPRAVPLRAIKALRSMAAFPLVRIPRLSVMPVSSQEWAEIVRLAHS